MAKRSFEENEIDPIRKELLQVLKYPTKKCKGMPLSPSASFPSGILYEEAAHIFIAHVNPSLQSIGYWALGRCLSQKETELIADGRVLNKLELFHEANRLDPTNPFPYTALGFALSKHTVTKLFDGRSLTRLQLCLEAVRLGKDNPLFFLSLGNALEPGQRATLHTGQSWCTQDLFVEALRLDPALYVAYYNLATTLGADETVALSDGRCLTNVHLYLESLKINPSYAVAYNELGTVLDIALSRNADVTLPVLPDLRCLTPIELYTEAIRHDPQYALAFYNLGLALSVKESGRDSAALSSIVLSDGREMQAYQLFIEAAILDPNDNDFYDEVRSHVPPTALWSRRAHAAVFRGETNTIFATLLLGFQRLEETGVVALAHQAMLEDMLEGWTWRDAVVLSTLQECVNWFERDVQ